MTDLILILGVTSVSVGAGLIFLPAGLIVAGVLAVAGVIFYERAAGDDRQADRPGP